MLPENLKKAVEKRIDALQKRHTSLVKEEAALEKDIQALIEMHKYLSQLAPGSLNFLEDELLMEEDSPEQQKTNFQKIAHFIAISHANKPCTIPEIGCGTGIGRPSISAVLYRTHHQYFVKLGSPDSRFSRWRMRTEKEMNMKEEDIPF